MNCGRLPPSSGRDNVGPRISSSNGKAAWLQERSVMEHLAEDELSRLDPILETSTRLGVMGAEMASSFVGEDALEAAISLQDASVDSKAGFGGGSCFGLESSMSLAFAALPEATPPRESTGHSPGISEYFPAL